MVQQKSYFNREEGPIHGLMDAVHSPDIEQAKKPIVDPTSASSALRTVGQSTKKSTMVQLDALAGVTQVASFTHSIKTRADRVKFAHQALCNPKISTLLKAV